jgi:hypothetical protein
MDIDLAVQKYMGDASLADSRTVSWLVSDSFKAAQMNDLRCVHASCSAE